MKGNCEAHIKRGVQTKSDKTMNSRALAGGSSLTVHCGQRVVKLPSRMASIILAQVERLLPCQLAHLPICHIPVYKAAWISDGVRICVERSSHRPPQCACSESELTDDRSSVPSAWLVENTLDDGPMLHGPAPLSHRCSIILACPSNKLCLARPSCST